MIIHVVKPGDSIYKIAKKYGVPPKKILSDNQLDNPNALAVGQTIVVLNDSSYHTVLPGQSIYFIAMLYGVSVADIIRENPTINNLLNLGQVIKLPGHAKLGKIKVNGYCYPNADRNVLRTSYPSLTYLSIFSYQVHADGTFSTIQDVPLIQEAIAAEVAPKMVLTNIEEGGSFSSELASAILNDKQVSRQLIDNAIRVMQEKHYFGLDVDFEYLFPEDRESYNDFLRMASQQLHAHGFELSTAVAPKLSADQKGLLYEAHDYAAHGRYCDEVILMTYEWGYLKGPPMAVAPLDQVEKVIQYAVTEIPPEKILMGIPNYCYDWTLPFVQGSSARILSMPQAVQLAVEVGAHIQYDDLAQSPFFYYYDDDKRQHVVWMEDARSIEAKLRLVKQYHLGGISYWTVNNLFPQNWLVLNALFDVEKVI